MEMESQSLSEIEQLKNLQSSKSFASNTNHLQEPGFKYIMQGFIVGTSTMLT